MKRKVGELSPQNEHHGRSQAENDPWRNGSREVTEIEKRSPERCEDFEDQKDAVRILPAGSHHSCCYCVVRQPE